MTIPRALPRERVPPRLQHPWNRHPCPKYPPSPNPTVRPASRLRRQRTSPPRRLPRVPRLPASPTRAQSHPWLQHARAKALQNPMVTKTTVAAGQSPKRQRRNPRQAHATSLAHGTASNEAQTAKSSMEEMKKRRRQREAATAAQKLGAATALLTFENEVPRLAFLKGAEAALVMRTKQTWLPNLILQSPHEAAPSFHED